MVLKRPYPLLYLFAVRVDGVGSLRLFHFRPMTGSENGRYQPHSFINHNVEFTCHTCLQNNPVKQWRLLLRPAIIGGELDNGYRLRSDQNLFRRKLG